MLTHYLGRARYIRPVARGGYYNKGEGIRMALAIGAAGCGDFGSFHAEPLDPRSGATEPVVLVFNYGILVNKLGQRFVNEAPATVDATYEGNHPDHFRAAGRHRLCRARCAHRRRAELAALGALRPAADHRRNRAGAGGQARHRSARAGGDDEAYNAACPGGVFKPLETDGLATPARHDTAEIALGAADRAAAVPCLSDHLRQLLHLWRAQDRHRQPGDRRRRRGDPGLYAAGETIGLYYGTYAGATSVLRGAVFGRIAGAHAAGLVS